MVGYRKKKENSYIKCKECKKTFCTEEYDMTRNVGGKNGTQL